MPLIDLIVQQRKQIQKNLVTYLDPHFPPAMVEKCCQIVVDQFQVILDSLEGTNASE